MVFELFWSEKAHRISPFWSETGYGFPSGLALGILHSWVGTIFSASTSVNL